MEPIITASKLNKIYRTSTSRINALSGVDVSIMPGEFVAIVGTSGSGKSTLLSVLAGLEAPSSGKVMVRRHPVHRMSESQLVDFRLKYVGFIFQAFNLMPTLSTVENAAFALCCRGVRKAERDAKAKKLLTEMGLGSHLGHKPTELSGGQQQRVSIARALITQPEIVFADEPTGNLDTHTSEQIMNLLRTYSKEHNATVLIVTHDMEKARGADRIIRLSDGKVAQHTEEDIIQ